MIQKQTQLTINNLLESGIPATEVAMRTGVSIGTVYKYKRLGGKLQGSTPRAANVQLMTELEPYKELIDSHIRRHKIKLKTLTFAVQQAGYTGRSELIEQYYKERRQVLQPQRYLKHVETEKGAQAQVDWGHFGEISINGKNEKVYLFAYILSWSRALYLEFVVRQNQSTLQHCHIRAFEALGIPKTIVYDNMKTVVSRRKRLADGTNEVDYNAAFMDFARYYQFEVFACPPYWPRTKGKVEATIKYVRRYFPRVSPRHPHTLEELNQRLAKWITEQAHERIHGTTHEKPSKRWLEEKPYLIFPTKLPPYDAAPLQISYTTQYGLLIKNGITYNLGPTYARLKLEVREIHDHGVPLLEIYRQNKLIARVPVPSKKHSWVSVDQTMRPEHDQGIDSQTSNQPSKRRHAAYDIEVEQRDLNYYNIGGF